MKPRSKWLLILLVVALSAAAGRFIFDTQQRHDASDVPRTKVAPSAPKPTSAGEDARAKALRAPPNSLRFVRGDDAEPVHVSVRVGTPGHYPPREDEVEKGGFFELPELLDTSDGRVSTHEVFARSQDQKDAFWSLVSASPDDDEAQRVKLRPASPLRIEVVDPTGAPLSGAKVRLSRGLIGLIHQTETASENGEVDFGAIPEGDFQLSAYADGFVRHTRHLLHAIRADSEGATTRVVLDRGATVTGRVLDEFGVPVVDAQVAIIPVSPFADEILDANFLAQVGVASQISRTDAAGRFSVGGIQTGAVQVRAEAPGYGAGLSALTRVKGHTTTRISDLILAREVRRDDLLIRVNLRDATRGLSAVELRVPAGKEDAGRRCVGRRVSERDWRFINCGSGERELLATTTDGVALRWKGQLEDESEITLAAPRRVEIYVVDTLGAPVSGAMVQLWQDGQMLLEGISAGAAPIPYDTSLPFRATLIARDARRGAGRTRLEITAEQPADAARAVLTLDRGLFDLSLPPGVINRREDIERHLGADIVQDDQQWIVDIVPADSGAGRAGIQRGDRILLVQRVGEAVDVMVWRDGELLKVTL